MRGLLNIFRRKKPDVVLFEMDCPACDSTGFQYKPYTPRYPTPEHDTYGMTMVSVRCDVCAGTGDIVIRPRLDKWKKEHGGT